jgi:hypothetical protein
MGPFLSNLIKNLKFRETKKFGKIKKLVNFMKRSQATGGLFEL